MEQLDAYMGTAKFYKDLIIDVMQEAKEVTIDEFGNEDHAEALLEDLKKLWVHKMKHSHVIGPPPRKAHQILSPQRHAEEGSHQYHKDAPPMSSFHCHKELPPHPSHQIDNLHKAPQPVNQIKILTPSFLSPMLPMPQLAGVPRISPPPQKRIKILKPKVSSSNNTLYQSSFLPQLDGTDSFGNVGMDDPSSSEDEVEQDCNAGGEWDFICEPDQPSSSSARRRAKNNLQEQADVPGINLAEFTKEDDKILDKDDVETQMSSEDPEHFAVCLFERVQQRSGNWKLKLSSMILHANDRELAFQTCDVEAKFC